MAISSASSQNVPDLLRAVQKQIDIERKKRSKESKLKSDLPIIGLKEDDSSWQIKQNDAGYVVTGKKIERFASRTKFDDYYGQQRLRDIMQKMGIMSELERRGIEPDQRIVIGNPSIGDIVY